MLRNKLKLRTAKDLADFEALSVAIRSEEPLPHGRFTPSHYRAIHRHLFQDVSLGGPLPDCANDQRSEPILLS